MYCNFFLFIFYILGRYIYLHPEFSPIPESPIQIIIVLPTLFNVQFLYSFCPVTGWYQIFSRVVTRTPIQYFYVIITQILIPKEWTGKESIEIQWDGIFLSMFFPNSFPVAFINYYIGYPFHFIPSFFIVFFHKFFPVLPNSILKFGVKLLPAFSKLYEKALP